VQKDYFRDRITYILEEPFLGLDFHHNFGAVHAWRHGVDPYTHLSGDPANQTYVYPPLTLVAFAWTDLFPTGQQMVMTGMNGITTAFATSVPAIALWTCLIVLIIGCAAHRSWRTRVALHLPVIPLPFIFAVLLCSYPVCFEVERGNCNVLPLLAIVVICAVLRQPRPQVSDVIIGFCVAFAIGIKPYCVVLLPGLLVLWRIRAVGYALLWLLLQAVVLSPDMTRWFAVAAVENQTSTGLYLDWSHSIISHWALIWRDLHVPTVANLPAQGTVLLGLVVVCAVVSWPVMWMRNSDALAWPYLLWLTAVGTMLLPLAYDYNLFFALFAVASTWRRSDPWPVHVCAALTLPWWQPFYLGISNLPWLLLKTISIVLIGVLIMVRARPASAEARARIS